MAIAFSCTAKAFGRITGAFGCSFCGDGQKFQDNQNNLSIQSLHNAPNVPVALNFSVFS